VADEPGRAGDVEVEKVGGEAVEAGTGGEGSEERVEDGGAGEWYVRPVRPLRLDAEEGCQPDGRTRR
jgi:hypothetical protein